MLVLWVGLVFVPTGVPGAEWCVVGPGCLVCPWAVARPRAVRAASFARRVASKPGQAPPPPTGTAADPSGALRTGGAWCAGVGLARCPEARLWLSISNFARNSSMAHSNFEFIALELQRFWGVSKNDHDKLRAKCGWRWCRRRPWVPQPGPSPTGAAVRSCVWRYARGSGPFPPSVGVLQH